MNIAIFGATGKTGVYLVDLAIENGHSVQALVRSPEKVKDKNENLKIIIGDVGNYEDVLKTIQGTDVVISALGPTSNKGNPKYVEGGSHIISAMKETDINRIVVTTGAGVEFPEDEPKFINKFISFLLKTISKKVYEDSIAFIDHITNSDLDWTVIRVPRLTDKEINPDYRTGWVGINMGTTISRKTLASILLDQISDTKFIGKGPVMSD